MLFEQKSHINNRSVIRSLKPDTRNDASWELLKQPLYKPIANFENIRLLTKKYAELSRLNTPVIDLTTSLKIIYFRLFPPPPSLLTLLWCYRAMTERNGDDDASQITKTATSPA